MDVARDKLLAAGQAISTAAMVLRMELPVMEAFLKESRDMDNFGSIVAPTLYASPERRAAAAVVEPLFQAAVTFVQSYDAQIKRSESALKKVST